MLKKSASFVLASFRPSTGTRPPHHSAAHTDLVLLIRRTVRPEGTPPVSIRLRPRWTDVLSILRLGRHQEWMVAREMAMADPLGKAPQACLLVYDGQCRLCVTARNGLERLGTHSDATPNRKSTRLNSSHIQKSRMPSSA